MPICALSKNSTKWSPCRPRFEILPLRVQGAGGGGGRHLVLWLIVILCQIVRVCRCQGTDATLSVMCHR